ncbi:MAG TPA: PA14 domain-containing protein [Planctomycetota bacterium]|nr:PA14 domain-containing protein [Planctomycetota bacterium]
MKFAVAGLFAAALSAAAWAQDDPTRRPVQDPATERDTQNRRDLERNQDRRDAERKDHTKDEKKAGKEPFEADAQGQTKASKQGLIGEYYKLDKEFDKELPELTNRKPEHTQVDPMIWFGTFEDDKDFKVNGTTAAKPFMSGYTDNFAVCWHGWVRVPKDGTYKFFLSSDDGSKLWVHDKVVIDNSGAHAMDEDSGSVELKAGYHPIKVVYFENKEVEGVRLAWEYEGQEKQVVPPSAFFHDESMMKKKGMKDDFHKKDTEPKAEPK